MAVRAYYGLEGQLAAAIDGASSVLQVDPNFSGTLISSGFENNVDETWVIVASGGVSEVMRVVAVEGTNLVVERGFSQPFARGSTVAYVLTAEAVLAQVPEVQEPTLHGSGILSVYREGPNEFTLSVSDPEFFGTGGVDVLGVFPQMEFAFTQEDGACCGTPAGSGGAAGDAINSVVGEGLVTAFVNGQEATIRVVPPTFNAGANIQITGGWPTYTITATAGSGTVSSVGVGGGLTLTGSPSVNPTISITNTGVVAGNYGGVGINSRGQITVVPAGFNPVSEVVGGEGLTATRVGGVATLTPRVAAAGVSGIVALADETDPFDPNDTSSAATPAVVALALQGVEGSALAGSNSFAPEMPGLYTEVIGATSQAVSLAAGKNALVLAHVTAIDGTTPLAPIAFGVAVMDGTGVVRGNKTITQNSQDFSFVLTGPYSGTLALATTAMPAGASLQSYSLAVLLP